MNPYSSKIPENSVTAHGHRLVLAMRVFVLTLLGSILVVLGGMFIFDRILGEEMPLWFSMVSKLLSPLIRLVFISYCLYLFRSILTGFTLIGSAAEFAITTLILIFSDRPEPAWRPLLSTASYLLFATLVATLPIANPIWRRRLRLGVISWVPSLLFSAAIPFIQLELASHPTMLIAISAFALLPGLFGVLLIGWAFWRITDLDIIPRRAHGA